MITIAAMTVSKLRTIHSALVGGMPPGPSRLCGRIRVPAQGSLSRPLASVLPSRQGLPRPALGWGFARAAAQAVAEAVKRPPQAVILDGRYQAADLGLGLGRRRARRRAPRFGQARHRPLVNPEAPDGPIAEIAVDALQNQRLQVLQFERQGAGDAHMERAVAPLPTG